MDIQGQIAIVTGAASGLGEATIRALSAAGAKPVLWDLNAELGEAVAADIGGRFISTDVSSPDGVEASLASVLKTEGVPRILVNCAGIGPAQKTAGKKGAHDFNLFAKVIAVNLTGTFNTCRLVAAAMREAEPLAGGERGVLINTASIAAQDGQIGQVAYASSKGGVLAMTLPMARDLAQDGIRCNVIMPGLFDTPLLATAPEEVRQALAASIPFPPRLGDPNEFASMAVEIVRNTMMNGASVRVDGALRMAPK